MLMCSAVAVLFIALPANAEDVTSPFQAGLAAFQNEQYAEAIGLFKKAVAQEPKASAPWYWLGESYVKHGNMINAQCAFAKMLSYQESSEAANALSEVVVNRMREMSAKFSSPTAAQCVQLEKEIGP